MFSVSLPGCAPYLLFVVYRKWQQLLDKSTVHLIPRWVFFGVLMALYLLRMYLVNGWFIVTYGLGIYLLNLFIGFLSPQVATSAVIVDFRNALLLPARSRN